VIPLGLQVFSVFTSKSMIRKILFSLGESIGETPVNSQRFESFNLPLVFQCTGTNVNILEFEIYLLLYKCATIKK
jgi:hypothetical protein